MKGTSRCCSGLCVPRLHAFGPSQPIPKLALLHHGLGQPGCLCLCVDGFDLHNKSTWCAGLLGVLRQAYWTTFRYSRIHCQCLGLFRLDKTSTVPTSTRDNASVTLALDHWVIPWPLPSYPPYFVNSLHHFTGHPKPALERQIQMHGDVSKALSCATVTKAPSI